MLNNIISELKNLKGTEVKIFENGKCIYEKHSDGKESWKEYDYINHIAVCKCTNKKEEFKDYCNDANYVIRREYADGYILWRDYDEKNRVIHTVDTKQCETWFEYDVNDNLSNLKLIKSHEEQKEDERLERYASESSYAHNPLRRKKHARGDRS